jgi:crossover junction endodeoxyribonuclease RuvC
LIVLGIDPGTRHFGWGVVARTGTRLTHVAHGVIEAGMKQPLGERLVVIEKELERIVRTHGATAASIEGIFFAKDASAACKLGHARGVALLVCVRAGLEIGEYPPSRAKRAVTGSGRADKSQVALMIRAILCLPAVPPSDAADALALAVTHLQRMPMTPLRPASKGLDPLKPRKPLPATPLRMNPPARRVVQRP